MIKATRYWIIWTTHRAGAQSLCSGSLTVPALRMKREEVVEPGLSDIVKIVVGFCFSRVMSCELYICRLDGAELLTPRSLFRPMELHRCGKNE